jgi:replicative DNA helicase
MNNNTINIERAVLSTILYENDRFEYFDKELQEDIFFYEDHRLIYNAMKILYKKEYPIDEMSILNEVEEEKRTNIEISIVEVMSQNALTNVMGYIVELQKAHIDRKSHELTLQYQQKKLTLSQLQIQLEKVSNLYKREEKKDNHADAIDLSKLSPFLKNVIRDLEDINGHPISMILSTVLSSMGGLIGARAKIYNGMYEVYPVIWSIIIAPSSLATKSTLTRYTKKCIFGNLQDNLFDEYRGKLEKYKEEIKAYRNLSKDDKRNEIEPEKPEPRLLIFQNDGTPEAKLKSLEDNQNGGIIYYDEMRAELERTNNDKSYKALKTSTFDGERFHKRLVNGGSIILEHPVICENGLITEQWLMDVIHKDDIASGFMARYLYSYNQREDFRPLKIKRIDINTLQYADVGEFIIDMLDIDSSEPKTFVLEKEAYDYYKTWFNELSETIYHTESNEEATISIRLTTYVLKFALISYIFNMAYQKQNIIKDDKVAVSLEYIKEAIYIAEIFRNESDKVLELFQKSNKLHKKIDGISLKLQNKIRVTKDKRIRRSVALNIRGVKAEKLNKFIESGLFKEETVDGKRYILEC